MNAPSIVIEIDLTPATKKNSHRTTKKTSAIFVPSELVRWEEQVHFISGEAMRAARWPGPWAGRVTIAVDIRFPSWHEKDIQNYWDSLLDGMSGAVYDDDCQIDRTFQCRQKSSDNPGMTVYVWFHDFDLNELGKRRPREWHDLTCQDFSFPEIYPVVRSPRNATNMTRFTTYGLGRKKLEREKRSANKKRAKGGQSKAGTAGSGKTGSPRKKSTSRKRTSVPKASAATRKANRRRP